MKLLFESWRQYLNEEQVYLYHGTSSDFAHEMIDSYTVTAVETYWGDYHTAKDYAKSYENPAIIKVPLKNIRDEIKPNEALIQSYQEDYPEDLEDWTNSDQTALESLEIFGSVLLPSGALLQGATIDETPI
jgi:hypothetical protein